MTDQLDFDYLLAIPRLRVQNANAVSSPLTHGFPSVTAFTGLMWALERKADKAGIDVALNGVGVVCHDYQELTTDSGFIKTFQLTRNPIIQRNQRKLISKDGETKVPAIVEEGRIHLDVSLVFAIKSEDWRQDPEVLKTQTAQLAQLLSQMRIAGGTVVPPAKPWFKRYQPFVIDQSSDNDDDRQSEFYKRFRRLLPGSVLVARDDLIDKRLTELKKKQPERATRLNAWLSLSRLNWHYEPGDDNKKGHWAHDRGKGSGWLVPIPVGYGALTALQEPGSVANSRDDTTPFRFVESVFSMGEWLGVHRIKNASQLLWYGDTDEANGLYRCRNHYINNQTNHFVSIEE